MRSKIIRLLNSIKGKNNPTIIAAEISYFISDALREGNINLYEAYLLHGEELRLRRLGYLQPAWKNEVQISTCLAILNQKLLSHLFNETITSMLLHDWGLEAEGLNMERREHYIMERYESFLEANDSSARLEELLAIRGCYDTLSEEGGPYHNEVFPYDYYIPEELILRRTESTGYVKLLGEDIEELIVELSLI